MLAPAHAFALRSGFAVAFSLVALLLQACGGGGGGGGSSSADGLAVSPTSLSFSMPRSGPPPASQDVAVNVTNGAAAYAGAAYAPGVTPASWLNIQVLGAAPNYVFRFTAIPTGLGAGTHTTTVSIGIARSDGSVIAHRDVGVTFTVAASLGLSPTSLNFTHAIGAASPASQALSVTGNGAVSWTATADQSWVTLSATSGMTSTSINVGANPSGLAPGNYTATVTVAGGGDTKATNIALTVSAPAILPSQAELTFAGVNGATLSAHSLSIAINNGAEASWTATSNVPWLVFGASSGTTQQSVSVSVNPANGLLASGVHNATIVLHAMYGGATLEALVNVKLTLSPATLAVDSPTIVLGGTDGSDTAVKTLNLTLNTGTNAFPWTVSGFATGMQGAPMSGTVSATGTTLTLQPLTTTVGNTYTSTATFTANVNGDVVVRVVPVTVRIKPHRLFVHETGVALMSSPTLSKITQSIAVRENRGLTAAWTATSDQPWLVLTNASGTTPASFQLTANPSSLPNEAVSYANITVVSTDPTVTNTEIIRVGLYRTAAAPAVQRVATIDATEKPTGIVADPVRPYVYITYGTSTITVHHIYTGALLYTVAADGNSDLRSLAVDDEGSRLYAVDHGTKSIRVIDIAASTPTLVANWSTPLWSSGPGGFYADVDFTRINGRELLIGGGLEVIDAANGVVLNNAAASFLTSSLVATISGDGSKMFTANIDSAGHTVSRRMLAFDELNDLVSLGIPLQVSKDGANRGLTTDYSGTNVYRACWYENQEIERYDGTTLSTLSLVTSGTNGGVILGPDGFVYCARYYDGFFGHSWPDVWAVNPSTGATISAHEYNVAEQVRERQFVISGDGLRLLTRSQALVSASSATFTSTTIAP